MAEELWIGNNLEKSDRGLPDKLSLYLPQGTKKYHGKPQVRIGGESLQSALPA
jgi:hypothetical protein